MVAIRDALGPLGQRLLAAFVVVALSAVVVLTAAALIGTDRGVAAAQQEQRQQVADRAASAAADAYADAGGWAEADLGPLYSVAQGVGARLVVRDETGAIVSTTMPMGGGHGVGRSGVLADVIVGGDAVGTVQLMLSPTTTSGGRTVAWWWVAGAAVIALGIALGVSWYVTRRITAPLTALADAARAFAAGDRGTRVQIRPPGELGEVAVAFDSLADQVARTERVRHQQSADIAHELRTPLASLQAGLEELRDGLREPDPARLAGLHDQTLRLGRVVDDLGQLSAAESASLSLRLVDVDLDRIVAGALESQEPQLRTAGLALRRQISAPVPVRADPDRIHQAVLNLLANTVRYCRAGDQVTVRVYAENGRAVAQVADTGPGIAAADLPHVFERLWRGSRSGSVIGSGIGLAVVRELVEAHHGTVTVDSGPGNGTVFTIALPLDQQRLT